MNITMATHMARNEVPSYLALTAAPSATKRFESHKVRRIPIMMSESARACITASSEQGRLLPQALSEFFGSVADVAALHINLASGHLQIEVTHVEGGMSVPLCINAAPLSDGAAAHDGHGFSAAHTAAELLRCYMRHRHVQGERNLIAATRRHSQEGGLLV